MRLNVLENLMLGRNAHYIARISAFLLIKGGSLSKNQYCFQNE